MSRHLFTPFNTEAPQACKLSIDHTELRRYIKRSSARADYIVIATALRQRLSVRGFPSWFLQDAFRSGPKYSDRQKFLLAKSAPTEEAKPVIVFATTFSRTLQLSGLSRAIFLNQLRYLPRYMLQQVEFLNAWRAGRKLGALLICYDFSKVSKKTNTADRIDSPSQGDSTVRHLPAQLSNLQISPLDSAQNFPDEPGQETNGSHTAADTNSSQATLMTG